MIVKHRHAGNLLVEIGVVSRYASDGYFLIVIRAEEISLPNARRIQSSENGHMDASLLSPTYKLPSLPYSFDALEPCIDAATMQIHHDKHHQGYVDKLNAALAPYSEFHGLIIEDLLRRLDTVPEAIKETVRNQGGGHANHQFFWKVIGPPRNTRPTGRLSEAIDHDFGDFDSFKKGFSEVALKHFGSGWTFLVINPESKRLEIMALPNQDSVLLHKRPGLLACDLWEHAYYLRYQNRRNEYLDAWWNVVAWDVVSARLEHFFEGKQQL